MTYVQAEDLRRKTSLEHRAEVEKIEKQHQNTLSQLQIEAQAAHKQLEERLIREKDAEIDAVEVRHRSLCLRI